MLVTVAEIVELNPLRQPDQVRFQGGTELEQITWLTRECQACGEVLVNRRMIRFERQEEWGSTETVVQSPVLPEQTSRALPEMPPSNALSSYGHFSG